MRQLRWTIAAALAIATALATVSGMTAAAGAAGTALAASQGPRPHTILARHLPPPSPGGREQMRPVADAFRAVYQTIWAGHVVPDSLYGGRKITGVAAEWVQPRVPADSHYHCTARSCVGPTASEWTGFQGRTKDLIQAGCDSLSAAKPVYYCWWEDFPKGTHLVSVPAVKPGQTMYVSIQYLGHQRTKFFFKNTITGKQHTYTESTPDVGQAQADYIVERLMGGKGGYYLPDFGSASFLADGFFQGSTENNLTSGKNVPYVMVNGCSSKDKLLATSGNVVNIDQFTVRWKASRPFSDKLCK